MRTGCRGRNPVLVEASTDKEKNADTVAQRMVLYMHLNYPTHSSACQQPLRSTDFQTFMNTASSFTRYLGQLQQLRTTSSAHHDTFAVTIWHMYSMLAGTALKRRHSTFVHLETLLKIHQQAWKSFLPASSSLTLYLQRHRVRFKFNEATLCFPA